MWAQLSDRASLGSIEARNCEFDWPGGGDVRSAGAICTAAMLPAMARWQGVDSPQRLIPQSMNESQRIDGMGVMERMTDQDALPQA
jgi:hypothetical protein